MDSRLEDSSFLRHHSPKEGVSLSLQHNSHTSSAEWNTFQCSVAQMHRTLLRWVECGYCGCTKTLRCWLSLHLPWEQFRLFFA